MKKIIVLLVIFQFIPASAQQIPSRLDSLFTAAYDAGTFHGNVLVADKGRIIYESSFGIANEQTKEPLNLETMFELASVSKQFTAAAIVLLHRQGKLNYDDKISNYIPELSFYEGVTIRHLLNHTGGIPDYMDLFERKWDKSKIAVNKDIIDLLVLEKPASLFVPSSKYEYSNTGYALLAVIIERASGQTFATYLDKHIFKPLKMNRTMVYTSRFAPKQVNNYARGYIVDNMRRKMLPEDTETEKLAYFLDGIVGDGTVNSTLHDLLKWDRALYTDAILTESERKLVFSKPVLSDGKESAYGFGWIVSQSPKYGNAVSHSGGWAGYITYIERHTDNDKTIILLQNNMSAATKNPLKEVRKILYNESLAVPVLTKITPSPADLLKYSGVYSNPKFPLKITIKPQGNVLTAQATGQSAFSMESFADHTFTFAAADVKLIFRPDSNTMHYSQAGNELVFSKE